MTPGLTWPSVQNTTQAPSAAARDRPPMPVRFVHAADLHLGLRLSRFERTAANQIAEARFVALGNLKQAAKDFGAQFILLAGDLFDDHSVPTELVSRVFPILNGTSWPGPVYVLPGNHDPLSPGCLWERDPWQRQQETPRLHLLRESIPVQVPGANVTLFPCPLRHRKSLSDPTAWIEGHPPTDDPGFRVGVAHGSLKILPQLPDDDHLIDADAAERLKLDYLALGHWHKPLRHKGRTFYPGTHESMRFPNVSVGDSIGWRGYSEDGEDERFADAGRGVAYLVEIDEPGAIPRVQEADIGHLHWKAERHDVTGRSPGHWIREFSERPDPMRTVLRLSLEGVYGPQEHRRLDELRQIVEGRYHAGSTFNADAVLIQPSDDQIREAVGDAVAARVLERLHEDIKVGDLATRAIAEHALKVLYRLAWEDRPV